MTLHTLQDQFKVYMIMCNMKVADIEAMMSRLMISAIPDGFLAGEADTNVAFERLQVLHQCCTDHVYRNDSVIIKIYQSRVESGLEICEQNWARMDELWATTAATIDDSPGELRTTYSEYRDWLYDVLRNKLFFPTKMPFRRSGEADPSRGERLTIQADPALPPPTTLRPQGTSTTSGGPGGRRQRDIKFGSTY